MASSAARLVVFCGLPGVGKTTLARLTAEALAATYLRIDTIEAAVATALHPFVDNPVGYVVANWVAGDQLRAGRSVVADAVNGLELVREEWRWTADRWEVPLRWVEVTCSDVAEHRRRVTSRVPELPGQGQPTWREVEHRTWQPFTGEDSRLSVDNVGDPRRVLKSIVGWLEGDDPGSDPDR